MTRLTQRQLLPLIVCLILSTVAGAGPALAQEKGNVDVAHIPDIAVAAVVIHPKKLLAEPSLELMPVEVIQAGGEQAFGINPLEIEQGIGFIGPVFPGAAPEWGFVLHFSKPQELGGVILDMMQPADHKGTEFLSSPNRMEPSVCLVNKTTLLLAPEATLRTMIDIKQGKGPLRTLLSSAKVDADVTAIVAIEPIRQLLNQVVAMAPPLPPQAEPLLTIPEHLDSLRIDLNLLSGRPSSVTLSGKDAASAEQLETILVSAMTFAKQMFLAETERGIGPDADLVQQAQLKYAKRLADAIEAKLKPTRKGNDVRITIDATPSMATTSVLVGLLLPAVQQAREAARRTHTRNNLKQIGLAMHNYHDVYRSFPAQANYDKKKPLLSWRVHVLPYIDQGALYDQFNLEEPWDSPHNKKLIDQMPPIYQNPNLANKDFKTNYLAVSGKNTVFPGEDATGIKDIIDGTSNTIMVVEADEPVIWTKPDDWDYKEKKPAQGLGTFRRGGFFSLFSDGSVRFISVNVDPDILRAWFTPAGGEIVN